MKHAAPSDAWIQRARSVPIEAEIERRGFKLKRAGHELIGPCPRCGGEDRFGINVAKQVWNCRGCGKGGDVIDLVQHLDGVDFIAAGTTLAGEPPPPKMNGANHAAEPKKIAAAKYKYEDEAGNLAFMVVRVEYQNADGAFVQTKDGKRQKTFRQCRPDPEQSDKWIWNVDGVAVLPYKLPALIETIGNGHFVVIAEGEAKVDLLWTWNVPATCNAGGAGKWKPEHSAFLCGADVIIVPDNDMAGRKHCDIVAASLQGVASSVRVLDLPGLGPKQDIIDWAKAGGTVERLHDLIAHEARPWTLRTDSTTDSNDGDAGSTDQQEHEAAPGGAADAEEPAELPSIQWVDMSNWDNEPRPEREWAIFNRVPLNQVGLFSGEGGTGKSIIEMMKDVAHVTGKDWLGSLPELGPAFYIGAEDEEKEIHIRFHDIAAHYGVTFKDLIDGGLKVLCKLGQDATLCAVGRSGRVETTAFYRQLYQAAGDIKPKNISIDTLSRTFAGSEIDRVQVYAFAMHMQALAMVAGGSVTVLSHPSLAGIASGSGISGSTAWHGAFRFRQYLKGGPNNGDEQPDNDLRQIEFKKNQYGPTAETIVLRYQRGLFLPEGSMSTLDKLAAEQRADELFMTLLAQFDKQGRNVSDKQTANAYAPTAFAKENTAKTQGIRKADLEAAMRRLFEAGRLRVENYGRPSRPASKLAPASGLKGEQN